MTFKGWQKTSLIEYPGKVSTVLFTGGCNFRCPFCYNTSLVLQPQKLPDLPEEIVLEYLHDNRRLYEAVVVSGGEPTLCGELPAFLGRAKSLGLAVGLETNGSDPSVLRALLGEGLVDYLAMDVKAPLRWSSYRAAAGLKEEQQVLLDRVLETLELLKTAPAEVELRCTVVPALHSREDLLVLASQLRGRRRFVLQQFLPDEALDPDFKAKKPFDAGILAGIQRDISPFFESCEIRGT